MLVYCDLWKKKKWQKISGSKGRRKRNTHIFKKGLSKDFSAKTSPLPEGAHPTRVLKGNPPLLPNSSYPCTYPWQKVFVKTEKMLTLEKEKIWVYFPVLKSYMLKTHQNSRVNKQIPTKYREAFPPRRCSLTKGKRCFLFPLIAMPLWP